MNTSNTFIKIFIEMLEYFYGLTQRIHCPKMIKNFYESQQKDPYPTLSVEKYRNN